MSADTVTVGDSAWVDVSYGTSCGPNVTDTLRVQINFGCQEVPHLYRKSFAQTDMLPKMYYNERYPSSNVDDSVVRIHFIIPAPCTFGSATYIVASTNVSGYNLPITDTIFIKDSTTVVPPDTTITPDTTTTGVAQLHLPKTIKQVEYYDLMGRFLGSSAGDNTNTSGLWPSAIYIRRIRYTDGTLRTEKVLINSRGD